MEDPSRGALPFPLTTSAKEGDSEAPVKRPREEDLPSDDEGLKSRHSGRSSREALAKGDDEKGWVLGLSDERGVREAEEAPTAGISPVAVR
jgi:hypothetical protein